METHVTDMVVHIPTYQCAFLLAFSVHERMASAAQNTHLDLDSCAINGCFFA